MKYVIPKEIKTEVKLGPIFLSDLFFLLIWAALTRLTAYIVSDKLQILYAIYSMGVGLYLTLPSRANPQKKNWHTLLYIFKKQKTVYKPISAPEEEK